MELQSHIQPQEQRKIPHALEAEKSILASMLQDPKSKISQARNAGITPEHFYLPAHQVLFELFIGFQEEEKPIDLVTLHQELHDRKLLDSVGGPSAIVDLSSNSSAGAHFDYHLDMIVLKWAARRIIIESNSAIERAYSNEDPDVIIADIVNGIGCLEARVDTEERTIRDVLKDWGELIKERIENPEKVCGLLTGLKTLDRATLGLQPEQLVMVSAPPSMGKTAFMLQTAIIAAVEGHPVLIFSYEMNEMELAMRKATLVTGIEGSLLQKPAETTQEERAKMRQFIKNTSKLDLRIRGSKFQEIGRMVAYVEKWAAAKRAEYPANKFPVVAADYAQLMLYSGKTNNETEKLTHISRSLKRCAAKTGSCFVVGSQITPDGKGGGNTKGARAFEEDANVHIRINQDSFQLLKNRNGPSGFKWDVRFDKKTQRFTEVET